MPGELKIMLLFYALNIHNIKSRIQNMSGRLDSNQRPPQPHCGALPDCATPRLYNFTTKRYEHNNYSKNDATM